MSTVADVPPKVSGPGVGASARPAGGGTGGVPVAPATVQDCLDSATFWAKNLGAYAASMQTLADRYTMIASVLSTVTGLAIWTTISTSATWWSQIVTGAMAIIVAVVAIVPKVRGYGDCAVAAAALAPDYGHAKGELINALYALQSGDPNAPHAAHAAVLNFEAIKRRKDALRPYPKDLDDIKYGRKAPTR